MELRNRIVDLCFQPRARSRVSIPLSLRSRQQQCAPEAGLRWNCHGGCWELRPPETGGNTFFEGEVEPCINRGVLALGAYFCRPVESLTRRGIPA